MQRNNEDRADAARAALDAYIATNTAEYGHEPIEDQIGDLLCDLLHLARRDDPNQEFVDGDCMAHNPADLLDRARTNFEEEEREELLPDEDEEDEDDDPFRCQSCGRPESDCSEDPCEDVIADREATV